MISSTEITLDGLPSDAGRNLPATVGMLRDRITLNSWSNMCSQCLQSHPARCCSLIVLRTVSGASKVRRASCPSSAVWRGCDSSSSRRGVLRITSSPSGGLVVVAWDVEGEGNGNLVGSLARLATRPQVRSWSWQWSFRWNLFLQREQA